MLRNIAAWAIAFVVSLLLSLIPGLGVVQGPAFLVAYLIVCAGVLIFTLVTSLVASNINGSMQGAGVLALWNAGIVLLITLAALAVSGLAAWFFKLDYFVAYQLVTLGQCLMWTIKLPGAPGADARSKADADSTHRPARATHYASSDKYAPND